MKPFPSSRAAALWVGLAVLLVTGCRNTPPRVSDIGVSSPPPPLFGSTPIAAYDDYARATAPATRVHIGTLAQVTPD